jgi:site-specific recombinase XerD
VPQTHNKGRRFPIEVLAPDEVKAMLYACNPQTFTGCRNRAILVLLYRAQLRVGEALSLRECDLNWEQGSIRVLRGKGSKARTVGLDPGGWKVLQRWLRYKHGLGYGGDGEPLFCTFRGKVVLPAYCRRLVKRLARRVGIKKRVHCHGFRHTGAVELAREGVPVPQISQQLGHASIAMTERYLQGLQPEETIRRIRKRKWHVHRGRAQHPTEADYRTYRRHVKRRKRRKT